MCSISAYTCIYHTHNNSWHYVDIGDVSILQRCIDWWGVGIRKWYLESSAIVFHLWAKFLHDVGVSHVSILWRCTDCVRYRNQEMILPQSTMPTINTPARIEALPIVRPASETTGDGTIDCTQVPSRHCLADAFEEDMSALLQIQFRPSVSRVKACLSSLVWKCSSAVISCTISCMP